MIVPFPIASNRSRNPYVASERLYNMYVEYTPRGTDSGPLYRAPGTRRVPGTPLSNDPCRGAFGWQDVGYMVTGDKLYQFTPTNGFFDIQERGTLLSNASRVSFAADLDEIVMVDGQNGYVYNTDSGVFSQILDPDFQGGTHVAQLNGFMLTNRPTSGVWQISRPQAALDWDALDIAVSEANGDNVLALAAHQERAWIFGSHTLEVWVPNAAESFPFSRQAVLEVGIGAPYSLAKADNSLIWLDWEGHVRRTVGLQTTVISNQNLADAVADMGAYSDAFAYVFTERNHMFYRLTFPTAGETWDFDFATQQWSERGYYDPVLQRETRHHSNCYMRAGGKHLVGDYRDGRVYEMASDIRTDDEGLQTWEVITPTIVDAKQPDRLLRFANLVLDAQVGVGTQRVPNPRVLMSYSDDGGHTWADDTSRELDLGMGAEGYSRKLRWTRLGRTKGKGRRFRFRGSDDVATSLTTATARVA